MNIHRKSKAAIASPNDCRESVPVSQKFVGIPFQSPQKVMKAVMLSAVQPIADFVMARDYKII